MSRARGPCPDRAPEAVGTNDVGFPRPAQPPSLELAAFSWVGSGHHLSFFGRADEGLASHVTFDFLP
jgi:hypothetical protein